MEFKYRKDVFKGKTFFAVSLDGKFIGHVYAIGKSDWVVDGYSKIRFKRKEDAAKALLMLNYGLGLVKRN